MKKAIKEHRIAVFTISARLVEMHPDLVASLLSGLLITKAEFDYSRNAFIYQAFSLEFGEAEEGMQAPKVGILRIEKQHTVPGSIGHKQYRLVELKFCNQEHDMVKVI